MDIFINIIVGLLTGCISSFIVTLLWQKRQDKLEIIRNRKEAEYEHTRDFRDDIQTLCRYLRRVELELDLPAYPEKYANLRRLVESQPPTPTFVNGMTKDGVKIMSELYKNLQEINHEAIGMSLTDAECNKYYGVFFKIECELIMKQRQFQKPWSEYSQKA